MLKIKYNKAKQYKQLINLYLTDYVARNKKSFNPDSLLFKLLKCIFKISHGEGHLFCIKLDVNNRCNLKCKFCFVKKGSEELDLTHIFRLIDSLTIGKIEIMGGEPLLRENILYIIRYIKKNGLECSLFTNATLISKRMASDLKNAGLDSVVVTLSSDSESVHDNLTRVQGSWKKTVEGIKNLVDVGIKTSTRTVIMSKNINRLKEIDAFSKKIGATPLFFRYIPRSKKDPLAVRDNKRLEKVRKWVLYEKSPAHGKFIGNMLALIGRGCGGGYNLLSVKSNGDVTPCPFMEDIILGNIKNKNIRDIFKTRFRNKEFREFFYPAKDCTACSLVNMCNSGCKAANKILFGDYNKKDCQCLGPWKSKPPFEKICEYIPQWW